MPGAEQSQNLGYGEGALEKGSVLTDMHGRRRQIRAEMANPRHTVNTVPLVKASSAAPFMSHFVEA